MNTGLTTKEPKSTHRGVELYGSVFQKLQLIREAQHGEVTKKQLEFFKSSVGLFRKHLKSVHRNQGTNKTGRLLAALTDYQTKYDSLIKGLDKQFMLFVVGTGNYGKSTLINALLETNAAEVDFLPKTWKIDIFQKDLPENQAQIKYRDNHVNRVTKKQAKEIIALEEAKRSKSEKQITAKLNEQRKSLPSFEAFKELRLKLEREEMYNSDIVEVHWGMKKTKILDQFDIVDTPGLAQTVMGEVRNNVQDYYHKADGVLWMLDATAIAASNAKKLVAELEESLSNIGGKQQKNIIAVLNRIDLIFERQGIDGVKQVLADAERIFHGYFRAIIPFSALQAFNGVLGKNPELIETSGLNSLYREIDQAFLKNAKTIQYNKKLESCYAYNREILKLIEEYLVDIDADIEKFNKGVEDAQNQLDKKSKELIKQTKPQIETYRKRVQENISYKSSQFFSISGQDAQQRFVNNEIFEMNYLTNLLNKVHEDANQEFTKLSNLHIKKLYFTEYPSLQEQILLHFANDFGVKVDMNRDLSGENFMAIGSGIASGLAAALFLGPVGLLAAPIVGWFMKKNARQENLDSKLNSELKKVTAEMTKKVEESIDTLAEQAYGEIFAKVDASFTDVYSHLDDSGDDLIKTQDLGEELAEKLSKKAPDFYPPLIELVL